MVNKKGGPSGVADARFAASPAVDVRGVIDGTPSRKPKLC